MHCTLSRALNSRYINTIIGYMKMTNMKTNLIAIIALIAAIGLLSTAIPYADALDVPSTATIIGVCGLVTVPVAISYGVLAPNAESSDQTLQLTNTGNAQAAVVVRGTDWSIPLVSNAMLVSATHYSLTAGQAYDSKTALTGTDIQLTTLTALEQENSFWQLRATLNDPATVGPTTQIVTLTGQC
jgi:hypothetical protein